MLQYTTYLLSILLLFSSHLMQAQEEVSLIEHYAQKSKVFLQSNEDSASYYLEKYLSLSKVEQDSLNLASGYKLYGIFSDIHGEYDQSLSYYDSAKVIFNALNNDFGTANITYNKAYLFEKLGRHEEAIQYFLESKTLYDSLGEYLNMGRAVVSIGNNYFRVEMYDKAREKFIEAIEVFRENGHLAQLAMGYVGLGAIYNQTKKYDSALLVYEEALNALDSADVRGRSIILTNLGNVHSSLENQEAAIAYYMNALHLKEQIGDKRGKLILLNNLSDASLVQGKVEEAREYAENGLYQARELKDLLLIKDFSYKLFEICKHEGSYEDALHYLEAHNELKDSLTNIDRATALVELEAKYEDEVNENKIMALELTNKSSESQRNAVLFISGILLLIVIFGSVWLINVRKYSRLMTSKNQEITKALAEKEVLIKEVHHRVKNNLQTISSLLSMQSRYMDDTSRQIVNEGRNRVKSMALIHQKLYQTDNLTGVQFADYFSNLTSSLFASYNINQGKVTLHSDIEPLNLDVDTAIPIGLIVNELISNTLKYAFPEDREGELNISFKQKNSTLELMVSDNGVGLPKDFDVSGASGFGMRLIQVLGEKLEATLDISSNSGTNVLMIFKNYKISPV